MGCFHAGMLLRRWVIHSVDFKAPPSDFSLPEKGVSPPSLSKLQLEPQRDYLLTGDRKPTPPPVPLVSEATVLPANSPGAIRMGFRTEQLIGTLTAMEFVSWVVDAQGQIQYQWAPVSYQVLREQRTSFLETGLLSSFTQGDPLLPTEGDVNPSLSDLHVIAFQRAKSSVSLPLKESMRAEALRFRKGLKAELQSFHYAGRSVLKRQGGSRASRQLAGIV